MLARYFDRMKAIVESHGGIVEKFIGDAVMALFGAPVAHEDDALRACRAAVEMREAFPSLGLKGRIGVNTGEVVTGTEERLATGDAVNVAARLEQAASPGDVLIGSRTLALVASAVDVEAVDPLRLKGKSEPVPAYRLLAAAGTLERRFSTPMIGRGQELQQVRDVFAHAVHERSCRLVTVLGSAGRGQVTSRGGVPRGDGCAHHARSLCLLRRRHHVLAGRRDSQAGRDAAGRRCGEAPARAARRERRDRVSPGDRLGLSQAARAGSASPAADLRASTTCIGPRRRFSISSSTSRPRRERPDPRCSARLGRNCSSGGRVGAAADGTRRLSCSSRSTRQRARSCWRRSVTRRRSSTNESSTPPRETRCSSRRCSRSSATARMATSTCLRRSRRSSQPASTSSNRPSGRCSSAARSREEPSIAGPSPRSPSRSDRSTSRCSRWCARS